MDGTGTRKTEGRGLAYDRWASHPIHVLFIVAKALGHNFLNAFRTYAFVVFPRERMICLF